MTVREGLDRSRYRWTVRRIVRQIKADGHPRVEDVDRALDLAPAGHQAYWNAVRLAVGSGYMFTHKSYPAVLVPTELVDEIERIFTEEHTDD